MTEITKYQKKNIAIYGLGMTGLSAAKALKKLRAKIYCWDDNEKVRKKIKNLNLNIEKFWVKNTIIDKIVLSPGIDINKCKLKKFLKKNYSKIITDLDLFFSFNKKSLIISITGTNGKSTTCKIIEKILRLAKLKVETVGNIGNPILFSKTSRNKIYILEVSSYQLEYSKLIYSKHAAILNISSDHLDRHKNILNYIKIKSKIFKAQDKNSYSYINSSNKYSKKIIKFLKKQKVKSKLIKINSNSCNHILKKIKNNYFNNKGNIENLSFAYKIAKNLNIKDEIVVKAANQFKSLPHRQEIFFSNKKILCVNDSKATSFDASLQSLSNYNKIYWILGGVPKYKDNFNLNKIKKNIVKAYIVGKNINFFKNKIKNNIEYQVSKNIQNAVNDISKDLKFNSKGNITILLSPAAASFDQFDNFEKRGAYFKNLIIKKFNRKKDAKF